MRVHDLTHMLRSGLLFAGIAMLVLVSTSKVAATESVLLHEDFTAYGGWQGAFACGTGCVGYQEALPLNSGIASSTSAYPHLWWVDRNHGAPGGLGDLNMVAWVCVGTRLNNDLPCASGIPILDLQDAKLRLRIRATCCADSYPYGGFTRAGPYSWTHTRLVWWFDTWDAGIARFVNMAAIGKPLDADLNDGLWHTVEIAPKLNDWACLGSINIRADFYGCDPATLVLGSVDVATGLIFFPVNSQGIPTGRLEIDWLEIVK